MSLPTQREIIVNTIAALEAARSSLADAVNWLHADCRPTGSSFPPAAAEARTRTLRTARTDTIEIEAAKRLLYEALEQLDSQYAERTG